MYRYFFPLLLLLAFSLNDFEKEFFRLVNDIPSQQRDIMFLNVELSSVARQHACDMGNRGYFSHITPEGVHANQRVLDTGIELPNFYSPNSNSIESIAAGLQNPLSILNLWINSSAHRPHLLGEVLFFKEQVNIGIGYCFVPNSQYQHYWVFLSIP